MQNRSIFPKVKELFSTDVVIRRSGGKRLSVSDFNAVQAFGNLQSNQVVSKYNRLYNYSTYNSTYDTGNYANIPSRPILYSKYEQMDTDGIISKALDVLVEEATQKNEIGEVLSIRSSSENIQQELYHLFYNVLNIEFNLPMWIRGMTKYGDFFLSLKIAQDMGVYSTTPLSVYEMVREEGQDANNADYVRFIRNKGTTAGDYNVNLNTQESDVYENYEVAHFRLLKDANFFPYGKSWLEPARKLYDQYILLEDAAILHRVTRSAEKRIFYYNVGGIPPNEVDAFMQKQLQSMKKTPLIDPVTGQYNLKFNMQNMMEDFHIPRRNGDTTTMIDNAKGLEYSGMDDINYFLQKLLTALGVPKAFLNYSDELNGKCLHPDTKIPLLNGTEKTIKEISDLFQSEEDPNLWVYSYDKETNSIIPGKVVMAEKTRLNAKLVKVTLDNGESLITTPDHGFVRRGGDRVEAQDLKEGDSLQAVYRKFEKIRNNQSEYEHVYQPNEDKWVLTHKMVDEYFNDKIENNGFDTDGKFKRDDLIVVHHKDFNRYNNQPDNLQRCTYREHSAIHVKNAEKGIWSNSAKEKAKLTKQGDEYRAKASLIGKENMKKQCERDPESKNRVRDIWLSLSFEERSKINTDKITPEMCEKLSLAAKRTYKHRSKFMREGQLKWLKENPGFNKGDKSPRWTERPTYESILKFIKEYKGDKSEIDTRAKLAPKMGYLLDVFSEGLQNSGWDVSQFFNENFGFCVGRSFKVSNEFLINALSNCESIKDFKVKYNCGRVGLKKLEKTLGEPLTNYIGKTFNHKVVSVEFLDYTSDTYNMEVFDKNENHNFLTSAGVIIKNSTLSGLSLSFSKSIEYIQRLVIKELQKIASVHLAFCGYPDSDILNFKLSLTVSSILAEQEKIALLKEKFSLMGDIIDKKLVSSDWCYDNIFKMSEDQINTERELITEDVKRTFKYSQIEGEGNDPTISGISYGTPHDLASIYKNNAAGKPATDLPTGYDEEERVGRPKKYSSTYGTDKSGFGRDPLGKVDTHDNGDKEKVSFNNRVKTLALEAKMYRDIMNLRQPKVCTLYEKEEKPLSLLDERNILDI